MTTLCGFEIHEDVFSYLIEEQGLNSIIEIECGEQMTIARCADIHAQLLAAIQDRRAVYIDISQLQRIDTAALQLFYCFQREARIQGVVTIWSEPSKVFCDAVDILGMETFYRQEA